MLIGEVQPLAEQADLAVFSRTVRDQIDFVYPDAEHCTPQEPYGCYANIDRTRASGVELEFRRAFSPRWRATGNASLLRTRNESPGLEGLRLPHTPGVLASLDSDYDVSGRLNLGLGLRYAGESYDNVANTRRLKAYGLADLRLNYEVGPRLSLFARLENLTGARYETAGGYGQTGRRLWLGIHTRLFNLRPGA